MVITLPNGDRCEVLSPRVHVAIPEQVQSRLQSLPTRGDVDCIVVYPAEAAVVKGDGPKKKELKKQLSEANTKIFRLEGQIAALKRQLAEEQKRFELLELVMW